MLMESCFVIGGEPHYPLHLLITADLLSVEALGTFSLDQQTWSSVGPSKALEAFLKDYFLFSEDSLICEGAALG